MISGGDALVAVVPPRGVSPAALRVIVGAHDLTSEFATRPDGGRYEGLLTGLADGRNVLRVQVQGHHTARVTIVNHPIGGPVISGPQMRPWVCRNGSRDPQCNGPISHSCEYKSALTGAMRPYDPSHPPSDVAMTTTQTGVKLPFIIRIETGYEDRDQYEIAVLFQPGRPWSPWEPQSQWTHKLLITHGASCGIDHQSASAPSVTDDTAVSTAWRSAIARPRRLASGSP